MYEINHLYTKITFAYEKCRDFGHLYANTTFTYAVCHKISHYYKEIILAYEEYRDTTARSSETSF